MQRNGVRRETGRQRTRAEVPGVDLHDVRLDPLPQHPQSFGATNFKEESNFLRNQKKAQETESRWTT